MNKNLFAKEAANAFRRNDYENALKFYDKAGSVYGRHLFEANIEICKKRLSALRQIGLIDIADVVKNNAFKVTNKEIKKINFFCVYAEQYIDKEIDLILSKNKPISYLFSVSECNLIEFDLFVQDAGKSAKNESALLVFQFLNINNTEINHQHPDCKHSDRYKNYLYSSVSNNVKIRVPQNCNSILMKVYRWKSDQTTEITIKSKLDIKRTEGTEGQLSFWQAPGFEIVESNERKENMTVYSILDEFSDWAFSFDLNLVRITPEDWVSQMQQVKGEFLLVESAWKGNNSEWQYALTNPRNDKHRVLLEMIKYCNENKIPTVFWNKEDPPNFNVFIDIALKFDYIFTTDSNCIPKYEEKANHSSIYALPFFAQPKIHNPIGKTESNDFNIAFAGTWYANKHKERCELAPILLDPSLEKGLTIFNRMSDWKQDKSYSFPDKYSSALKSKITYKEMLSVHKIFKIFLNINSVIDSPTMFSRRIFEVLASCTPVVSTRSIGVNQMFDGIVSTPENQAEADDILNNLLFNDWHRKRIGHKGYRQVMERHTCQHRIKDICSKIGIEYKNDKELKVTWAVPTNRPQHLKYIIENFERQTYKNIELLVALNSDEFNLDDVKEAFRQHSNVKIIQLPESASLGEVLNATLKIMTGDVWMKIDDDNVYMENFTSDMLLPFLFANVNIVGKGSYFAYLEDSDETILRFPGNDNKYVTFCSGSALAVRKVVFENTIFPAQSVGEDTVWMKDCVARGEKIYSPDIYNYVVVRRKDLSSHTWKADPAQIKKNSLLIGKGMCLEIVGV